MPSGDHVHALREVSDGSLPPGLQHALCRRDDHGSLWQLATLQGQDGMSLGAADPDGLLFAGHDVLQRSSDGGSTWQTVR